MEGKPGSSPNSSFGLRIKAIDLDTYDSRTRPLAIALVTVGNTWVGIELIITRTHSSSSSVRLNVAPDISLSALEHVCLRLEQP